MWLTTKQVADRFGVTQRRVRQLARDRGIAGRKIGPIWVFTEDEVTEMKPRQPGAGGHTRNILIKALGDQVDEIVADAARQNSTKRQPGGDQAVDTGDQANDGSSGSVSGSLPTPPENTEPG